MRQKAGDAKKRRAEALAKAAKSMRTAKAVLTEIAAIESILSNCQFYGFDPNDPDIERLRCDSELIRDVLLWVMGGRYLSSPAEEPMQRLLTKIDEAVDKEIARRAARGPAPIFAWPPAKSPEGVN